VAGAQVSAYNDLFGRSQFYAQTDEEGRFTLYDLPPGPYHVFCEAPGWANYARRNIVVNGEEPASVDFELSAGGTLVGKVVGTDGQTPVEGASVATLSADQAAFDPSPTGLSYRTATTDEDGAFALPNLRPGQYEILIAGPESGEWTRRPVEVKEGETATMEVRLEE
jgi:protocatechuate 3,4-dioxygenase beta subunit